MKRSDRPGREQHREAFDRPLHQQHYTAFADANLITFGSTSLAKSDGRFKQSGVILTGARHNCIQNPAIVDEVCVARRPLIHIARINLPIGRLLQHQLAMNRRIRPSHARNRQAHHLQAAHEVPRSIQIKQPLRHIDMTHATLLQRKQLLRRYGKHRNMLRHLMLTQIPIDESDIKPLQVMAEQISRQQTFLQRIPIAEFDNRVL